MINKKNNFFSTFINGLIEFWGFPSVFLLFSMILITLSAFIYIPFNERSIHKEIEKNLIALAPSISEIKSKLIEVKNNPNSNPIKFDNKAVTLTIQSSKDLKNEKKLFFKVKNVFICEELYNMTNENFKINQIKSYNYENQIITDSKMIKNIAITYYKGKNNSQSDIVRTCALNNNIEFDVIK